MVQMGIYRISSQSIVSQKSVASRLLSCLFVMLAITGCQLTQSEKQPVHPISVSTSTSNQCPDISGIYYDLAISISESKKIQGKDISYHALDAPNKKDASLYRFGDSYPYVISSYCSLRFLFDPTFESDRKIGYAFLSACPARTIEFKRLDNFNYDVITYKRNQIVSEFTINLIDLGYRCEEGNIMLYENKDFVADIKDVMFLDDGSLIQKVSSYILFHGNTETLTKWGRTDGVIDPYLFCATEHKEDNE